VRFVFFVEGETERRGIAGFLSRYLSARSNESIGIKVVGFTGWHDLVDDLSQKAHRLLNDPVRGSEIIALFALLDLYGPTFYPGHALTATQRIVWAKRHFEKRVNHPRFRLYFAVHEIEAWFLSDTSLFPKELHKVLKSKAKNPEAVNFDKPPKALLKVLYREKLKREYKPVTQGFEFFSRLDPAAAAAVCPNLRAMLQEMELLAKKAGL
jgi:hypothetical protein